MQVRNSQFEKSLLNKLARVANRLELEVETELKVSFALTFSQFRVLNGLLALTPKGELAALDAGAAIKAREAVWRSRVKLQDEVALERALDELMHTGKQ